MSGAGASGTIRRRVAKRERRSLEAADSGRTVQRRRRTAGPSLERRPWRGEAAR
jgi:hypothetical protein